MRSGGLAALVAALAVGLGAAAPDAGATYPGGNGRIAYVDLDGDGVLVVVAADGSARREFRAVRGLWSVAWSPDGSRLAFTEARPRRTDREVPSRWALWVMDADGSNRRELAVFDGWLPDPAWSPDATEIAVPRFGATSGEIHAFNLASGTWRPVTSGGRDFFALHPSWSPDGASVAYVRADERQDVIEVTSAGGGGSPATVVRGFAPEWSPDGTRLLVNRGRLATVRPDGSDLRSLHPLESGWDAGWSPDGTKVVFANGRVGKVGVANADGTCASTIPGTKGGHAPDWQPVPGGTPSEYVRCANLHVRATFLRSRGNAGRTSELAVSIVNRGNDVAAAARFTQNLHRSFTFMSVRGASCTGAERLTCSVGTLAPGEVARVRLTLRVRRGGRLASVVRASSATFESDPSDNADRAELYACSHTGTAGADRIVGTAAADVICSGAGADRIFGRGGNDSILAGRGDDVLDGGSGNDYLEGGTGNDVILGGPGHDRIEAEESERDVIDGGPGKDSSIDDRFDRVRRVEFDTQGTLTGRP